MNLDYQFGNCILIRELISDGSIDAPHAFTNAQKNKKEKQGSKALIAKKVFNSLFILVQQLMYLRTSSKFSLNCKMPR